LWWIHVGFVCAGLLIAVINFVSLGDTVFSLGLIPDAIRKPMEMYVGVHDGYVQITSNNIGPLFLIVPYLVARQFLPDASAPNGKLEKLTLALCMALVIVCGRRALWLVVAITPCTLLVLALITRAYQRMGAVRRGLLWMYTTVALFGAAVLVAWPSTATPFPTVDHLKEAFSSQDERTIQKPFLVRGFLESPLIGAGLGAYAGYPRSEDRPWTYELTYHQMLFNMGALGVGLVTALFLAYFALVVRLIRAFPADSAIPFALLLAICSLLIGSYSNPYVRSFDFLFFVGLLPFMATFTHGFASGLQQQEQSA